MGLFSGIKAKSISSLRLGLFNRNYQPGFDEAKLERLFMHVDQQYPPSPEVLAYEEKQRLKYSKKGRSSDTPEGLHAWMTKRLP